MSDAFWEDIRKQLRRYVLCPVCRGSGTIVVVGLSWWDRHICGEYPIQQCPACAGHLMVFHADNARDDAVRAK